MKFLAFSQFVTVLGGHATIRHAPFEPFGAPGVGIGIAAGALLGAAAISNAYASPVYVTGLTCRLVTRYDRFGNARIPGLQLLLIRWIGARNVHPRADLEDPPGMSSFGRVTLFRI